MGARMPGSADGPVDALQCGNSYCLPSGLPSLPLCAGFSATRACTCQKCLHWRSSHGAPCGARQGSAPAAGMLAMRAQCLTLQVRPVRPRGIRQPCAGTPRNPTQLANQSANPPAYARAHRDLPQQGDQHNQGRAGDPGPGPLHRHPGGTRNASAGGRRHHSTREHARAAAHARPPQQRPQRPSGGGAGRAGGAAVHATPPR